MELTVAICTRNDKQGKLITCLHSINNQLRGIQSELLLVENVTENQFYSKCTLENVVGTTCQVKYFTVRKDNLAGSRNVVLRKARGAILIFIDDDIEASFNAINKVREFFKNKPSATAVVGEYLPLDKKNVWSYISCRYWMQRLTNTRQTKNIYCFPMAFSAFQTHLVHKTRVAFDESLDTGEDIDFYLKLIEKGARLYYHPAITTKHSFPSSCLNFFRKHYRYGRNFLYLNNKHPKTYSLVENIWKYLPIKHTHRCTIFLVAFVKILRLTKEFIKRERLHIGYFPVAFTLYYALLTGVYSSAESKRYLV